VTRLKSKLHEAFRDTRADVIFRLALAAGCDIDELYRINYTSEIWRLTQTTSNQLLLRQPLWHRQASTYPYADKKRVR